jgi:hypothetical protein
LFIAEIERPDQKLRKNQARSESREPPLGKGGEKFCDEPGIRFCSLQVVDEKDGIEADPSVARKES